MLFMLYVKKQSSHLVIPCLFLYIQISQISTNPGLKTDQNWHKSCLTGCKSWPKPGKHLIWRHCLHKGSYHHFIHRYKQLCDHFARASPCVPLCPVLFWSPRRCCCAGNGWFGYVMWAGGKSHTPLSLSLSVSRALLLPPRTEKHTERKLSGPVRLRDLKEKPPQLCRIIM